MVSNTTRTAAKSRKAEPARTGFVEKEPLIDRMSPADHQRALHDDSDLGPVSRNGSGSAFRGFCGEIDYDHSLF